MKILSVGGSIIIPQTGFNPDFLKKFRTLILKRVAQGEKFIIVTGGGSIARQYQNGARLLGKPTNSDLDWIGIQTTILNAHFMRVLFSGYSHDEIILNPHQKIKTTKPLIFAGGEKPGCSTDLDAVDFAHTYDAKDILNLSNIDYVFDKDPNKFSDAKRIEDMNWETFRRDVVGYTWDPGKNVPFDPTASTAAAKWKMTVSILNGNNLKEVAKAIDGKKFKGTRIHP
ncbi:MAG: hypothetical protein A2821_00160 [Candidatus Magasanikbacteria bacterium RIFCSPHIGHO2_01_FULL_41_23]|uniref:UMP kinase n=1 Tax=Candidatus Magasanikbacteria bacterium RIFCSPLOWO2_01_FULL_40_15 TaxID=1798686 RepID=A0A1F6N4F3_9BACT|nr:MAG: hypothetical protein A2821_00160 [Candidatus Magasanikbacteria bacterium RIFCSPHIGHO2_01_FULL_41_23]OGH76592.1 MAG: hypothetical protein A3F22_04610 [Candidatus Magasanikbacteria bacterium RIFCSPHIGHO2_12_FULL_41_16]OGH78570.1 MAG: hypothetical protein A2983_02810 [Candidatus Magasanikbacteria bacterium RIFCSPLOWO2_01_FULL_40_15]